MIEFGLIGLAISLVVVIVALVVTLRLDSDPSLVVAAMIFSWLWGIFVAVVAVVEVLA